MSAAAGPLAIPSLVRTGVPWPIRRNTWLLFIAQVMLTTGLSTNSQLGSLIIYKLTGAAGLAGLPVAIHYIVLASIGYPAGRFMDQRGRRLGLVIGYLLAAVGALLVALGIFRLYILGYLIGLVVFNLGVGVGMFTRAAAADMYPDERRAGAVGFVVAGGLIGGVSGPLLIALGDRLARTFGGEPLAVPWTFIIMTFALAALAVSRLRPDPREISMRLTEYFPGAATAGAAESGVEQPGPSVAAILSTRQARAAMIALASAQATMAMLMATSALLLAFHGHGMTTISLAVMVHILGMFALAVPVGRLADRIGRRPVMIGGALLSASSGLVFTLGASSAWVASAAFFLVGLGWCLAFVPGAALLGDLSGAATRARVMGINDVFTNLSAMAAALLGGVLLARGNEAVLGIAAAILGSVPLVAILWADRAARPLPAAALVPADGGK